TLFRNIVWGHPVTLWFEAVNEAPDRWLPHLGLAEALQERDGCASAVPEYEAVVRLGPSEPFAYGRLGACRVEAGQLDLAGQLFRRFEGLDPTSPLSAIGFGTIAMARHDQQAAEQHLRDALAKDPENVPARRLLAEVVEADRPAEALRLCQEV